MVDRALMFSYSGAIVFTSEDYYFGICRLSWAEVHWEKCGKNSRIFDRKKMRMNFSKNHFGWQQEIFEKLGNCTVKVDTLIFYCVVMIWQCHNSEMTNWKKLQLLHHDHSVITSLPPQKLMDFSKEKISCQLWFADQIEFN